MTSPVTIIIVLIDNAFRRRRLPSRRHERVCVPEVIRQSDVSFSFSCFLHHTSTRVCVSDSRPHARTHTHTHTNDWYQFRWQVRDGSHGGRSTAPASMNTPTDVPQLAPYLAARRSHIVCIITAVA